MELKKNQVGVPLHNSNLNTLMFADDIILFSTTVVGLQSQLKTFEIFCGKWKLEVIIIITQTAAIAIEPLTTHPDEWAEPSHK